MKRNERCISRTSYSSGHSITRLQIDLRVPTAVLSWIIELPSSVYAFPLISASNYYSRSFTHLWRRNYTGREPVTSMLEWLTIVISRTSWVPWMLASFGSLPLLLEREGEGLLLLSRFPIKSLYTREQNTREKTKSAHSKNHLKPSSVIVEQNQISKRFFLFHIISRVSGFIDFMFRVIDDHHFVLTFQDKHTYVHIQICVDINRGERLFISIIFTFWVVHLND